MIYNNRQKLSKPLNTNLIYVLEALKVTCTIARH